MSRTKITRNYQITLPKDVREKLGVKIGDTITLISEKDEIKMKKFDENILEKTFGSWKIKETGVEYVKKIREGDKKRLRRLGL